MRGAERLAIALVLVVAAVVLLPALGDAPLRPYDEGLYARLAHNTLLHGEWLHAVEADGRFSESFSKPPLSLWMTAWSFRLLGPSMAALRLPFALGMLAVVAIAVGFGTRAKDPWFGALWGAAITLTAATLRWGRFACIEPTFIAFVLLALWGHAEAIAARGRKADRWALVCGVGLTLAFFTKQLAVGLAVAPLLLTELVLRREAAAGRVRRLAIALLTPALLGGAWLFGAWRRVGPALFDTFFSTSVARRIGGFESGHNARALGELAGIVDEAMAPLSWTLGVAGLAFALLRRRVQADAEPQSDRLRAAVPSLVGLAVTATVLYDNVARTLLPWYAFAFVPPLAAGIAELAWTVARSGRPGASRGTIEVATITAGVLALSLAVVATARAWVSPLDVALAIAAGVVIVLSRSDRARWAGPFVAAALGLVAIGLRRAPELRTEASGLGVLMAELHRRGVTHVDVHEDTGAAAEIEYAAYFGPGAASVRSGPWRRAEPRAGAFVTASVPPRELEAPEGVELVRAPGVVAWVGDLSAAPWDDAATRALLDRGPITFEAEDLGTDTPGTLADDHSASGERMRSRAPRASELQGEGSLSHGPGWPLPLGKYEATFFVRHECPAPEASAGWVGVFVERREAVRATLACDRQAEDAWTPVTVGFRMIRPGRIDLRVVHVRGTLAHDRTVVRRVSD
jgi:4-amino-4-deoxy-L-arabinose transferase-like glycosyltransferase